MDRYDLVIVLGAQLKKEDSAYSLPAHTELRAWAAGIAWQRGLTGRFIISGGHNFGVRYSDQELLKEPDWSFRTLAVAGWKKSEAEAVRDYLILNYNVPREAMILEELSVTTKENALFVSTLLRRATFSRMRNLALLTSLYHMERARDLFHQVGVDVASLPAEDLIRREPGGEDAIRSYYSHRRRDWFPVVEAVLSGGGSFSQLLGSRIEVVSQYARRA